MILQAVSSHTFKKDRPKRLLRRSWATITRHASQASATRRAILRGPALQKEDRLWAALPKVAFENAGGQAADSARPPCCAIADEAEAGEAEQHYPPARELRSPDNPVQVLLGQSVPPVTER